MISRIKALGLILVGTIAIGGTVAPAASASTTILTGTQEGTDVFSTTAGTVSCTEATYEGTQPNAETAIVEPKYSGCTAFGFAGATVNANGCEYEFHGGGTMDIQGCNSASGVIITAKLFGVLKCTMTVGEQAGIGGIAYTGSAPEMTVDVAIENDLEYIHHAGSGIGACTSGSAADGDYSGTTKVVFHTATFHSEGATTVLKGSQVGTDVFSTTAGTFVCTELTYSGSASGTSVASVVVEPAYSGCSAFGTWGVTVDTNGCEYEFHAGGTMDIQGCDSASGIIITTKSFSVTKCVVTVGEQSGISGFSYTNTGSGSTRAITADFNVADGISYTHHAGSGIGACTSGSGTDGDWSGEVAFTAENDEGTSHVGIWWTS